MRPLLRTGIVGYGRIGRLRHQGMRDEGSFVVTAIADPRSEAATGAPPGCAIHHDYRELLALDLDAVFVCTPNNVSASIAVDALDAGKHVFCEKPPGRTPAEVEAIVAAQRHHPGLKLKFGFNHRYHDAVREAVALVEGGGMGRLLWMRGLYGKSGGLGFEDDWRSRREIAGGGILLDQGIHMLDLFRLFAGDFDEVKSFVTTAFWEIDVEDNAFALLRNGRGQVAMLHSSSTQWKHLFSLEIFLSEGYVAVNGILSGTRSYGREQLVVARRQFDGDGYILGRPREEVTYFDTDLSWRRELEEFARCVREDVPVVHGTSRDALEALRLVYRIYQQDGDWWAKHYADVQPEEAP
jgi:predicted dehydrogenase